MTKTLKFQLSFTIKAFRLNFAITNIQKRTKLNIFHKEKINSGRSKSIKKGFGRIWQGWMVFRWLVPLPALRRRRSLNWSPGCPQPAALCAFHIWGRLQLANHEPTNSIISDQWAIQSLNSCRQKVSCGGKGVCAATEDRSAGARTGIWGAGAVGSKLAGGGETEWKCRNYPTPSAGLASACLAVGTGCTLVARTMASQVVRRGEEPYQAPFMWHSVPLVSTVNTFVCQQAWSVSPVVSGIQNQRWRQNRGLWACRPRCPRTGCSAGKSLRGSLRCWPRQGGCTTPSWMTLIWSRPLAQVRQFSSGWKLETQIWHILVWDDQTPEGKWLKYADDQNWSQCENKPTNGPYFLGYQPGVQVSIIKHLNWSSKVTNAKSILNTEPQKMGHSKMLARSNYKIPPWNNLDSLNTSSTRPVSPSFTLWGPSGVGLVREGKVENERFCVIPTNLLQCLPQSLLKLFAI